MLPTRIGAGRTGRRWTPPIFVASLLFVTSAVADVTIQGKSASLTAQGTDFFVLPGHQTAITAPDAASFTNTAEVHFDGHGSVDMDIKAAQDTHAQISGDDLTLTSTQSFSIVHEAKDPDRQNLLSRTNSFLTITFCTTKKSSFLFSASGQLAVPPEKGTTGAFKGHAFADAFVLATFVCPGCPQVAFKQFFVGVNVEAANGVAAQPNGSAQGSGTIPPGCYELSTNMDASLVSPLLCKNKTGVCQPFQIPPDVNKSPPSANGSFTLKLRVTPTTSTNDDEITWVGPSNGAFGDPANWSPQQVPTITPDESDTAIFAGGNTITVDVSAGAALAASPFAPRAGGSRATGRLHMKGTKKLVVTNFQFLDLDDHSLDKASLRIGNKGTLQFSSGSLIAHNARIGLNGGGTLVVADPDTFFMADLLLVGEDGDGLLHVKDGAAADATEARLGNGSGLGSATIEGLNTTWTTGKLSVGHQGPAVLLIQDTGVVTSTNAIVDENVPPAPVPADGPLPNRCSGRSGGAGVEVTGRSATSSAWHVDTLSIGGLGCVEASFQGGVVTGENTGGDVRVGTSQAGEGVLFVNTGGVLTVHGNLTVGESGHGRLELDENQVLDPRINVTGALRIGDALPPAGSGKVVVTGENATSAASLTSNSVSIPNGNDGFGKLTMTAGAIIATATSAEIGSEGTEPANGVGIVEIDGRPNTGPGAANLTRWNIGQSLTVGGTQVDSATGFLFIADAVVLVGSGPTHGTVTINAGGRVTASDQNASLLTNGGTLRNDGVITGPLLIEATYSNASSGKLAPSFGGIPTIVPASNLGRAATGGASALDSSGVAAAKLPPPPEGPIVITGDADLTNTTLVLQFVNGFAPHQGDQLPVVEVQGQTTGSFVDVQVVGLAPGASFNVDSQTGMATSLTDTVALPVVTMKAPKTLKESAKKGGKIKFARSGATTDPLTISYRVGGTADSGIDYGFLPGTLTIPAKKKSATLVVVPFTDGLPEPPETIEVTVLPGDTYQTSSTPAATITLLSTEKKPKK